MSAVSSLLSSLVFLGYSIPARFLYFFGIVFCLYAIFSLPRLFSKLMESLHCE